MLLVGTCMVEGIDDGVADRIKVGIDEGTTDGFACGMEDGFDEGKTEGGKVDCTSVGLLLGASENTTVGLEEGADESVVLVVVGAKERALVGNGEGFWASHCAGPVQQQQWTSP